MDSPPPKKSKNEQEGRMDAPPDKKESATISMLGVEWEDGKEFRISQAHRIGEYPWCFVLTAKEDGYHQLDLWCRKSIEAVLWKCTATIIVSSSSSKSRPREFIFQSWDVDSHRKCLGKFSDVTNLTVNIVCEEDGNSWRRFPSKPLVFDGILVIEEQKIDVNKESLASQSSFFDRLFNGDFREKNMMEIPILDVGYEEFVNILKLIYRSDEADLNGENVHRVVELAVRFQLEIVKDSAVNFYLSQKIPMKWKIEFAHRYHLQSMEKQINEYFVQKFGWRMETGEINTDLATAVKDLVGTKLDNEPVAETAMLKESALIVMIVNREVNVQFSHIYRINGYPWHICLWSSSFSKDKYFLTLICDKNRESELWKCTATVTVLADSGPNLRIRIHTFESWEEAGYWKCLGIYSTDLTKLTVIIECKEDGNSWRFRPYLNPSEPLDGTLVIGTEQRKIIVNKKALSSQSSYFHKHFFGGSEEKNEIFMEDAKFEEIYKIIHWLYHIFKTKQILTDKNIPRVLELGRKFDLKIVEDRIICYILSSPMPIQEKIRFAEQYKLPFIRDQLNLSQLEDPAAVYSEMKLSIDDLAPNQVELFSHVETIDGYDWRLLLTNDPDHKKCVYLVSDISSEAELWSRGPCTAKVVHPVHYDEDTYQFATWERQHKIFDDDAYDAASYPDRPTEVEVSIRRYRTYPIRDPPEPLDLMFGMEKRTIHVNKKSLAAQSPFFERLFCETKDVYKIEDVEYEEFLNIMKLMYNSEGAFLTDENVHRILELADYFEIKVLVGILVFGIEIRTIHVNKKSLAAQSPFFERLFSETKDVYEIEDVEYEEFLNIMKLMYNSEGAILRDENVHRVLELADYFEMKVVKDRVVSFLLSSFSSLSFPAKLLISDKFALPVLMVNLFKEQCNWVKTLQQLIESPEYKHLSPEMLRIFFNKFMV